MAVSGVRITNAQVLYIIVFCCTWVQFIYFLFILNIFSNPVKDYRSRETHDGKLYKLPTLNDVYN